LGTDKYRYGGEARCANKSVNGCIEQAVWTDLCALLKDPERLQREFERRLERPRDDDAQVEHLQSSITQLKRRIARLIDAYENGWLDKAELEPRITRTKERLAHEQERLAQHQRDASQDEELRLLFGEFATFARQMTEGLEQADFATRRKLLRLLVKRIEVDQDEVRIVYKVHPRPFADRPASRGVLQDCLEFHCAPLGRKTTNHLRQTDADFTNKSFSAVASRADASLVCLARRMSSGTSFGLRRTAQPRRMIGTRPLDSSLTTCGDSGGSTASEIVRTQPKGIPRRAHSRATMALSMSTIRA
jgi:hypothetical protein